MNSEGEKVLVQGDAEKLHAPSELHSLLSFKQDRVKK
jgi:hypothetical protein